MSAAANPTPETVTVKAREVMVLAGVTTLLAALTVALLWFAAVPPGPPVCAAVDPGPRNCFTSDRVQRGWMMTFSVLIVYAAVMWLILGSGSRMRRTLAVAGVALLALAPIASYLVVAWIPALAS